MLNDKEPKTKARLIKEYFGEGQTAKEFMEEFRQLTTEDRIELAQLIAKEQGVEVKD